MGTPGKPSLFDAWSLVYDNPLVQRAVYRPVHDAVLRELRRHPPRRILDIGCGTGILTARLQQEATAEVVYGCDLSAGMLAQATARRVAPLLRADAQRLPLADESVDAVVSTESFHWFPDPSAALAEFRRVLTPDGRVVLCLVNVRTAAAARLVETGSAALGQRAKWPTSAELRVRLERAGFRVERQQRVPRAGGIALPTVLTVAVPARGPR